MNIKIALLIALTLSLSYGCKRAITKETSRSLIKDSLTLINHQNFTQPIHLTFQDDSLQLSPSVFRLMVVDTVLLAADLSGEENLKIIGLNSKKLLKSLIKRGNTVNQTINITDFSATEKDKVIWSYDLTLKKFQRIDIFKALQQSSYIPEEEFTLGKGLPGITSPVWIQDRQFASLSLAKDDCRYLYFNAQSQIVKEIGQMPQPQSDWPEQSENARMGILGMSYSAIMRKHPTENRFVVLYENTDRIDFYYNDTLKKSISGPDHFKVVKAFRQQGTGAYVPRNIETTRYAFFDAYVTSKFIYALYSGTTKSTANQILVFDWNGIPVKRYVTDESLVYFAFKPSNNGFFVFGVRNGHLIHTSINKSQNE